MQTEQAETTNLETRFRTFSKQLVVSRRNDGLTTGNMDSGIILVV